jgi:hypothetical protein
LFAGPSDDWIAALIAPESEKGLYILTCTEAALLHLRFGPEEVFWCEISNS